MGIDGKLCRIAFIDIKLPKDLNRYNTGKVLQLALFVKSKCSHLLVNGLGQLQESSMLLRPPNTTKGLVDGIGEFVPQPPSKIGVYHLLAA